MDKYDFMEGNTKIHIGLIAAMPEEVGSALDNINIIEEKEFGDLKIHTGKWFLDKEKNNYIYISVVWSGWGKVSAARAVTRLISMQQDIEPVNLIFFTGLAGGTNKSLSQGDIVVPTSVMMHDMDARPLFERFEIPPLRLKKLYPNSQLTNFIENTLIEAIKTGDLKFFKKVRRGIVATGDKFISDNETLNLLCKDIPDLLAVEMEGAAVAQIAIQENIPWILLRVISDSANDDASQTFSQFLSTYKDYSWALVEVILQKYKNLYEYLR